MTDDAFVLKYRMPIGVIGSSEAVPGTPVYETAYKLALALAEQGFAILTGGRAGVMEAACKGARERGGLGIALLPSLDESIANPYAALVLPTDLGKVQNPIVRGPLDVSRNRVIASASLCLVAVGGGMGTANEIKHALAFGKTVFGLCGAPAPEAGLDIPRPAGSYVQVCNLESALDMIQNFVRRIG